MLREKREGQRVGKRQGGREEILTEILKPRKVISSLHARAICIMYDRPPTTTTPKPGSSSPAKFASTFLPRSDARPPTPLHNLRHSKDIKFACFTWSPTPLPVPRGGRGRQSLEPQPCTSLAASSLLGFLHEGANRNDTLALRRN